MARVVPHAVMTLTLACCALPVTGQGSDVPLVLYMPQPERFDVALDEIELQWKGDEGASGSAAPSARAALERRTRAGAVFRVQGLAAIEQVAAAMRELEDRNPGARGHLVLYEANRVRSESTRRLLGRDVAMLLADDRGPDSVLKGLQISGVRPVAAVSRAYVVEALDPLAAVRIAEALRNAPGVRGAYPLLQRTYATR